MLLYAQVRVHDRTYYMNLTPMKGERIQIVTAPPMAGKSLMASYLFYLRNIVTAGLDVAWSRLSNYANIVPDSGGADFALQLVTNSPAAQAELNRALALHKKGKTKVKPNPFGAQTFQDALERLQGTTMEYILHLAPYRNRLSIHYEALWLLQGRETLLLSYDLTTQVLRKDAMGHNLTEEYIPAGPGYPFRPWVSYPLHPYEVPWLYAVHGEIRGWRFYDLNRPAAPQASPAITDVDYAFHSVAARIAAAKKPQNDPSPKHAQALAEFLDLFVPGWREWWGLGKHPVQLRATRYHPSSLEEKLVKFGTAIFQDHSSTSVCFVDHFLDDLPPWLATDLLMLLNAFQQRLDLPPIVFFSRQDKEAWAELLRRVGLDETIALQPLRNDAAPPPTVEEATQTQTESEGE